MAEADPDLERALRRLRRERIRDEEEIERDGSARYRVISEYRRRDEQTQLEEEAEMKRIEAERNQLLEDEERRLVEEENRIILAEEERKQNMERKILSLRRQRKYLIDQRRSDQTSRLNTVDIENDLETVSICSYGSDPQNEAQADALQSDLTYESPDQGILTVHSRTDIDQYNDNAIETTPEMRIVDQTVNVKYSSSKLQESEGTRLKQPDFKTVLSTEIKNLDRRLEEMNRNTNSLLVRSKERVHTTAYYFKDPIIRELFPTKENATGETKMEPSLDPNKDLEGIIRNEFLIQEQEIQDREAKLYKLEKELQEREKWVINQEKLRYHYNEGLKERDKLVKEKIEEMKVRQQNIKDRETELKKRLPTNKSSNVEEMISNKTETNQFVHEIGTGYKILKPPDPKESEIGTAKPTTFDHRTEEQTVDRSMLFPKFTAFSGDEPKPKNEATYEEWKYEVNCTLKAGTYTEDILAQAMRKSLRNQAKRVILPLGVTANVESMLKRLEGVFGNVSTGESILHEFYTAFQKQEESIANWGLRLEEILQKAINKGHVKEEDKNEILRQKFWRSLRSDRLKNATRVQFECITNFDMLRSAVRAEENEMARSMNPQHQSMSAKNKEEKNTDKEDSKFSSIMKKLSEMDKQLKELQEQKQPWRNPRWQSNENRYNPNKWNQSKGYNNQKETNTTKKQSEN